MSTIFVTSLQENEDLVVKYLYGLSVDANIIGQIDGKFSQI